MCQSPISTRTTLGRNHLASEVRPDPAPGLFLKHFIKDGYNPVLKLAVVGVGDDEISYTIHTARSQTGPGGGELSKVGVSETFDEVFFDSAGGGDDGGDVVMLNEIAKGLS